MFCPECQKAGQPSKVYVGISRETCIGVTQFYDEGGKWHNHNPNRTTTEYTCSEGHKWTETTGPYHCPWGDFP